METEHRVLLRHFESQLDAAKTQFLELAKKIRSKRVVPLEKQLYSCKLFITLLTKIHFDEKRLMAKLFEPYEPLLKQLKKARHIKLIEVTFAEYDYVLNGKFKEYHQSLIDDKKQVYAQLFDLVVSWPLSRWEELYQNVAEKSHSLTPLQVNTATHQIITEELDGVVLAAGQALDATRVQEIYEGLSIILDAEKFRVGTGLNPVFTPSVHGQMRQLFSQFQQWYRNQLLLQHLAHFLGEKVEVPENYSKLVKGISKNHKAHIQKLGKNWGDLIQRMSG
jgi:hypothetical protein